jgi:MoaA/NifB/PqqE/SkfB family radical SAM enzyme
MRDVLDIAKRQLTLSTHHVYTLPVVVLMPHSRCNCRCVMCDIWKANHEKREITPDALAPHLATFRKFNVRRVVLSGGEALLHSNLWEFCKLLKEAAQAKITLLSTGLLLPSHTDNILRWCDDVIVSLDGSRKVHDTIRNISRAYDQLAAGVAALKTLDHRFRVTARCVIQRRNYFDLPNIITAAHTIGLDQISFLAADVTTTAFNRSTPWEKERAAEVALVQEEVVEFTRIVEQTIVDHAKDFASGFIAESPEKLRRLPRYYAALNNDGDFPSSICNAPWVSTVVEADGTVRPCFFHAPLGNIHERSLEDILNSDGAQAFRRALDIKTDPVCRVCVCSLQLKPWTIL